ncbi:DUF1833 family protein [Allisonella histaminiformans]|uniref:DUF1833 family protein n=1 Tax=Allisonella histaminiformans TaxID=209880 RepID=UPI0022E28BF5|nr:DUF1833 family protein [Allisonella histaminiformans]
MDISTASIIEKNKTCTDGVYLLLLEIQYKDEDPIRLAYNTEDIVFKGNTYYKYAFEISGVKRSSDELPDVTLSVSNITGTIQQILDKHNGVGGAKVTLMVINTNVPDELCDEEHFVITGSTCTSTKVDIKLGAGFSLRKRVPATRILKDWCPFKFKGARCGYSGVVSTCDKTRNCCKKLGNSVRFGGEPTIPQGGLYARRN